MSEDNEEEVEKIEFPYTKFGIQFKAEKPRPVKTEHIEFPKQKRGILRRLGDRRREAKAVRAEQKAHKKQVEQEYLKAYRKEEIKAVPARAARDVQERIAKRQRGKVDTLKRFGKGLYDLDRALAGKPKAKQRRKPGSKIVVIEDGKAKTLTVGQPMEQQEEYEEFDPASILFGSEPANTRNKKERKKDDPFDFLF